MPLTLSTRTHGRSITEPAHTNSDPAAGRSWLSRFFAGEEPLTAYAPAAHAGRMPPAEAAAVARALGCPDLFLLDSPDRITRERLLVHVLRAAAERGERLLVLSPDPAAADRLVEALASDRSLRVVRALADDENPVRPSSLVSRLIGREAGPHRAEQLRRDASQTVAALETKLARLERGRECRAKLDAIERERAVLAEKLAAAEGEALSTVVSAESADRLAALQAELAATQAKQAQQERQPSPSKSGFFARLLGLGKAPAQGHSREVHELVERDAKLTAECEVLMRQMADDREKGVAERRAAFAPRQTELDAEAARLEALYRECLPQTTTDDTVEDGATIRKTRMELDRELAVARTRQQELAAAGPDLAHRLIAETQIVVGTPGSLESDPVFPALGTATFERLVLDHAEELTEPAFERLAPLAARWLLAGDASPPPKPIANGRPARSRPVEPSLLTRLARQLDHEPWSHAGDRLIIRLTHLTDSQRQALAREPLLDHTDVELGMHAGDGEPVLAEIAFPIHTTIPAAKSFLFTQLGEVVLRPCGEPRWHRTEDRLTACWALLETAAGEWVDLEPGIREMIVGDGLSAFTAAVAFDMTAGWDEPAAETWLAARVAPTASRIAILPHEAATHPVFAR